MSKLIWESQRIRRKQQRLLAEQTYQKTDRGGEMKKQKRKDSKGRSAEFQDLESLADAVVHGKHPDGDVLFEEMHRQLYYGGITDDAFANSIFDPKLEDLMALPVGALDQKEELLPFELLPASPAELERHCQRMIIVADDCEEVVSEIVAGWSPLKTIAPYRRLEAHVKQLWGLREKHSHLFDAIVSGRHRDVILTLRRWRLDQEDARAKADFQKVLPIFIVHALIWCCHDLQLVIARNARTSNPFGALISSTYVTLAPERVAKILRGRRVMLEQVLDIYFAAPDWRTRDVLAPKGPREASSLMRNRLFTGIKKQVESQAAKAGIRVEALGDIVDPLMQHVARRLRDDDTFIHDAAEKASASRLPKDFSKLWFSDLSSVAASAVPLLRYLQAEAQLEAMIMELIPVKGEPHQARDGVALKAFRFSDLPRGSMERAKRLLMFYRERVMPDRDLVHSNSFEGAPGVSSGESSIMDARFFLEEMGERLLPDHEGGLGDARRTFFLLDVIPEHRLAVGMGRSEEDA